MSRGKQKLKFRTPDVLGRRTPKAIIAVLLIFALAGSYFLFFNFKQAQAAWWNDSWQYRKSIAVTNSSGGELTDFQVKVLSAVDLSADITAGKIQSDLDDLRFTDINGNILKYWIEDSTAASADVWAKLPTVPTSGVTVYMYYGNPNAQSQSNGNNVFTFFDDFNSGSLDTGKWAVTTSAAGSTAISSGKLRITSTNSSDVYEGVQSNVSFSEPTVSEMNVTVNSGTIGTAGDWIKVYMFDNQVSTSLKRGENVTGGAGGYYYSYYSGGWNKTGDSALTDGNSAVVKMVRNASAQESIYEVGSQIGSTYSGSAGSAPLWIKGSTSSNASFDVSVDYVFVRKYASTEPAAAAPGSEEKGTGPVAYWSFDEGSGPTAKDSKWKRAGSTTNLNWGNPSFETGTGNWTVASGALAQDTTKAVFGVSSGKFTGTAGNYFYGGAFTASASTAYTVSAFYQQTASGYAQMALRWRDSGHNTLSTDYFNLSSGNITDWARATGAATAPVNTAEVLVMFLTDFEGGAFTFWVDGVQLEAASAATPYCDGSLTGNGNHTWAGTAHASASTCDYGTDGSLNNMPVIANASSTSGWQSEDACVSGKCLAFDGGNDYVEIPDGPAFESQVGASGVVTFSAWVKPSNFSTNRDIIDKYENSSNVREYSLTALANTGQIEFFVTDATLSNYDSVKSTNSLVANQWSHVVAVYDNSQSGITNKIKLYINGKLETGIRDIYSGSFSQISDTAARVTIGASNVPSPGSLFSGKIDEPKIYNYARTAAQIKLDYNAGLSGQGGAAAEGSAVSAGGRSQKWMSDGLVGYWKMDEASWNGTAGEVTDWSGNSNSGTAAGNASTTAGKFGNGGIFDGTGDYVEAPASANYNFSSTNFTISTWFKSSNLSDTEQNIFNSNPHERFALEYNHGCHANTMAMYLSSNASTWDIAACAYGSKSNFNANEWYLATLTWDGSHYRVYINGVLDIDVVSSTPIYSDSPAIRFGYSVNSEYLTGGLDDFRIYRRALSDREVRDLYAWAPGPVAQYNFEEGGGQYAYDSSGNSNNGTLGAAATAGSDDPAWSQGKFGKALQFDGTSDYVNAPDSDSLDITGDLTVSAWIYPTSLGTWQQFVGKGQSGGPIDVNYDMWTSTSNSIRFSWGGDGVNGDYLDSNTTLSNNQWYHVVGVISSSTSISIYINGKLDNSKTTSVARQAVAQGLDIGGLGSYYFYGKVDDVKIYNYARTQKQIVEDMNGGHPAGGSPVGSQVGYWKFDEGYGAAAHDSSSQKNDGTLVGGTTGTWNNNGKFGKALVLDGTKYVNLGDPASLEMTDQFTLSAWINPTGVANYLQIISKFGAVGNYAYQYGLAPTGNLRVDFSGDGTAYGNLVTTTSPLTANTWQHVVATFNAGALNLYVNGKQVATGTSTITSVYSAGSTNVNIGRDPANDQYFVGSIDEPKIYNYALSADEVAVDYNHGKSLSLGSFSQSSAGVASSSAASAYCVPGSTDACSAPVGEWKFEEGSGGSANDTSGNGNTGTLTNGPTWTSGKYGKGLKFGGNDDYVDVASFFGDIDMTTQAFTAEFWVRDDYAGGSSAHEAMLGIKPTTATKIGFQIGRGSNGKLSYAFVQANGTLTSRAGFDGVIANDRWHHISFTNDGAGTYKGYIDGVLLSSIADTFSMDWFSGNNKVFIGAVYGTYEFHNYLDDVKIYNYARSQAQIAWDYNKGKPVGWWKMDECQGGTIHDASGFGNNGTWSGTGGGTQTTVGDCASSTPAGAWYNGASGKRNGSLNFDGTDDKVSCSDAVCPNLDIGSGQYSVGFWIKTTDTGSNRQVINKGNTGDWSWFFNLNNMSANKIELGLSQADGDAYIWSESTTSVNDGNWHHVMATWNPSGTTLKMYVDGKLEDTDTTTSGTFNNNSAGDFSIGYRQDNYNAFAGQIDDVRIYNYALTPAQVRDVYSQGAVGFR